MYKSFFGLNRNPFELSPDPFFLCPLGKSEESLATIHYAVTRRKGFVVLTGEVGTGKTLMIRYLCDLWKERQIPFAHVTAPRLSVTDFLSYVTFDLGIKVNEPTKGDLLRALYGFLVAQFEKGLTTILIVDEAHQTTRAVLEEIRVLTNFETAHEKLLQILLVGQPELDKKLDSFALRQLKQRIAIRCELEPLREKETGRYIEHRLRLGGANTQASTIFPADTVRAIHRYSSGIPRLVNSICEQALVAAYARQLLIVPVEIIHAVASYFRLEPGPDLGTTENVGMLEPEGNSTAVHPEPAAYAPVEKVLDLNTAFSQGPTAEAVPANHPLLSILAIGPREQSHVEDLPTTASVTDVSATETDRPASVAGADNNAETYVAAQSRMARDGSDPIEPWHEELSRDSNDTAPRLTTDTGQAPPRKASHEGSRLPPPSGTAVHAKAAMSWQRRSLISAGTIVLFVAGAGVVLFRSHVVGNAASTPAPGTEEPAMNTQGENSASQMEPSSAPPETTEHGAKTKAMGGRGSKHKRFAPRVASPDLAVPPPSNSNAPASSERSEPMHP